MRTITTIGAAWLPISVVFGVITGRYLRDHVR